MNKAEELNKKWMQYILSLSEPLTELAEKSGIPYGTLNRWRRGVGRPLADQVILFARRLNKDPLDLLVTAGYLEKAELRRDNPALSEYTDLELAQEGVRRIVSSLRIPVFEMPIDEIPAPTPLKKIPENQNSETRKPTPEMLEAFKQRRLTASTGLKVPTVIKRREEENEEILEELPVNALSLAASHDPLRTEKKKNK